LLPICPFEKGARWARILAARNNAQSCSSINQIPIICQLICEKKSILHLRGNHCRGSGVCWIGRRTEKWFGGMLVFRPRTGRNAPVSLMGLIIVKFTHAIAMVLKGIQIWVVRGATFGVGVTAPFVSSLPVARSRAPTLLCRGGCDCRVVPASSIPQGVCSLPHGCSCLVGASSYRFSHGRRKADQKH
jgi:hypothetical protein